MPSFFGKFGKKANNGNGAKKKSSSMGSLYKDYSGGGATGEAASGFSQEERGGGGYREMLVDADVPASGSKSGNSSPDLAKLQRENETLKEENNLLKLKVEILLDMLAQKTAESELVEADVLKMRNILANT